MYNYTCQHCGKRFAHRRPHHSPYAPRFCSPQCASASRRKHPEAHCAICGNVFQTTNIRKTYCSRACVYEAHRRHGLIECEWCGKSFKRSNRATRYCSARCYGDSMLSAFPRKGKEFSKAVRRAIKERDNYACVVCGSTHRLEIDHIVPIALGGDNSIDNGQALCHKCHRAKSLRQRKQVLRGY